MTEHLLGKPVAEAIESRVRTLIAEGLEARGRPPSLVSLHRGLPSPFAAYLGRQRTAATRLGIRFSDVVMNPAGGAQELRHQLETLERSRDFDAVLVEHPLPEEFDFAGGLRRLSPEKDVDGVGEANLGRLVTQGPTHAPAVALAALAILDHYRVLLAGVQVAVIGRSATVGLPTALLLAAKAPNRNATVTLTHSGTRDLGAALAGHPVIVSCAGQPGLLTRRVVPEGATIIDVGLSAQPAPSTGTGMRLVGDVDASEMEGWARAFTPVPGGVGPVTVAELMLSATQAWVALRGPGVQ